MHPRLSSGCSADLAPCLPSAGAAGRGCGVSRKLESSGTCPTRKTATTRFPLVPASAWLAVVAPVGGGSMVCMCLPR